MRALLLAVVLVLAASVNTSQADEDGLAGVYVQCPRKNEARCDEARDDFRMVFPNGQPYPYFMIKKGGDGYMAPDDRVTVNFTIVEQNPEVLLFRMNDKAKSKMELRKINAVWRDRQSGHIYVKAIEDEEWNIPPQPYKQKRKSEQK